MRVIGLKMVDAVNEWAKSVSQLSDLILIDSKGSTISMPPRLAPAFSPRSQSASGKFLH